MHMATSTHQPVRKPKSAREKEREEEFREAVRRLYEKYGNNFHAFLRDIQKEKELIKRG
jgi:translation initiation factor 2 alpha subunit (eIF-2alpha)